MQEHQARDIARQYLARIGNVAKLEHNFLPRENAHRYVMSSAGRCALIVGDDGSLLFAGAGTPAIRHEQAFAAGRRTNPSDFDAPALLQSQRL